MLQSYRQLAKLQRLKLLASQASELCLTPEVWQDVCLASDKTWAVWTCGCQND